MLADKNVFENNYKNEMSKRLLLPREDFESSLAAERYFITKLKMEEGHVFTSKIEGMLNDMALSSKTAEQFKKHKTYKSKPQDIDFNVNILTTNAWPSFQLSNPVLPKELKSCVDSFEKFYSESYSGRKITWQSTIGVGNVKGLFALGEYEMSCSTYQMMVLMLVNEDSNLTFKKILDATQVNEKDLKRNIQALYAGKYKVLDKSGSEKEIKDDDVFTVNKHFKSDKPSFTIQFSSSSSSSSSSSGSGTEQIPQIDAAIVKQMKSKLRLNITKLQTDVMLDLQSKFKCDPKLIRKRIEELIQNETIQLDSDDKTTVVYK
jgi:cullin 3